MKFTISYRAFKAMNNELARFPEVETGGLLLGYSKTEEYVNVLEATDGGYKNTIHNKHSFQYDVEYEEHICEILCNLYEPPLEVVGVWHKHNAVSETPFSNADKIMHLQLIEMYEHPCLSILFQKENNNKEIIQYKMQTFLLKENDIIEDITSRTCFE